MPKKSSMPQILKIIPIALTDGMAPPTSQQSLDGMTPELLSSKPPRLTLHVVGCSRLTCPGCAQSFIKTTRDWASSLQEARSVLESASRPHWADPMLGKASERLQTCLRKMSSRITSRLGRFRMRED